jgi:5,6-dimethylbenzimidazole synthase
MAGLAPSVGNSQPWRFVTVDDSHRRAQILETFRRCNDDALAAYSGERALRYTGLKLSGLVEAPCHIAVFVDEATSAGHKLGRRTMPETLDYSAVAAIQVLWLAARAHGLGVGWVSILDPAEVVKALEVPSTWSLVVYLCVGFPEEEHLDPELERHGWQLRADASACILRR